MNRLLKERKSQITVFIIIGIVLLVGAVTYFVLFSNRGDIVAQEESAAEVPLEVKPVKDFVESCAMKIGIEALKLAGQHGGYIYPTKTQDDGRTFAIDPMDPASSDGVAFTERSDSGVIYWWHMKTPNNCYNCLVTSENIPKMDSIERQTDQYIQDNLARCIDGFRLFAAEGFNITEIGDPVATTKVTEKDVVVNLRFPMRVEREGKTTDMNIFISHIPINLKRIYSLAYDIALTEGHHSFLEYVTQSWIAINSGLHTNQLPPFYAIEESYAPRIWVMDAVELQLKDLLTSYVSMLQVNSTKGASPIDFSSSDMGKGYYRSFFLNLINDSSVFNNYSVRFLYLGWPIYLKIRPDDDGVLKAARVTHIEMMVQGLAPFIPMVPQREYDFFYDLSYPVVVELKNSEDLFGEGYTWLFALESNLRDNRGMKEWFEGNGTYGPWDYSWITFNIPREEIAMVEGGENLSLVTQNLTKSLFCSPKQRISGNITVSVKNALTGLSLDGVSVKYSCGKYDSCMIGVTGFDIDINKTLLKGKFPVCVGGGIISIEKSGFKSESFIDLTTLPVEEQEFVFEMVPLFLKNVSVDVLTTDRVILYRSPLEDFGNNYTRFIRLNGGKAEVSDKETLIINIRKVDELSISAFGAQNIIIDNSTSEVAPTLKLVPGKYEIQTTYIDGSGAVILPEKRCQDNDNCMLIPEAPGLRLDQSIGGGLVLNDVTGYWDIGYDDLMSGNTVVFKVIKFPKPLVIEDLNEMSFSENLSAEFRTELQPKFK